MSLVERAERALDELQPQAAAALYREALAASPDDVAVLDALGEVLFQLDEPEEAASVLRRSAELAPSAGYSKWMYLAQLSCGLEAVAHYERGLVALEQQLAISAAAVPPSPAALALLHRRRGEALCALAELYMTDLCDEAGAEASAKRYADAALSADAENAGAHQIMGSLCLCSQQPEAAAHHLRAACALLVAMEESSAAAGAAATAGAGAGAGGAAAMELGGGPPGSSLGAVANSTLGLPPFETRLALARLCMEAFLYAEAGHLLEGLLCEDDTSMEIWFLAAEAAVLGGDPGTAVDLLTTADAMLTATLTALAVTGRKAAAARSPVAVISAASAASSVDFTPAAIETLLATPRAALLEQQCMVRALLEKAQADLAAAPATMEDDEEEAKE